MVSRGQGPGHSTCPFITRPYFDEGGESRWIVSITRPIRDDRGRFIGVAGVDLTLGDLNGRFRAYRETSGARSHPGRRNRRPETAQPGPEAAPDQGPVPEMAYLASPGDPSGRGSMVFALPKRLRDYLVRRDVADSGQEAVNLADLVA